MYQRHPERPFQPTDARISPADERPAATRSCRELDIRLAAARAHALRSRMFKSMVLRLWRTFVIGAGRNVSGVSGG